MVAFATDLLFNNVFIWSTKDVIDETLCTPNGLTAFASNRLAVHFVSTLYPSFLFLPWKASAVSDISTTSLLYGTINVGEFSMPSPLPLSAK